MTVIEARGLRKEFSVRVKAGWLRRRTRIVTAVDDIDLSVERGETLGYIGPNGAGKSTTLKMLTGVLYPSAGHVRVCGLEPVPQRLRLARRIGVVFGQRSSSGGICRSPTRSRCSVTCTACRPRTTPPAWDAAGGSSTSTPFSTRRCGSSPSASACAAR